MCWWKTGLLNEIAFFARKELVASFLTPICLSATGSKGSLLKAFSIRVKESAKLSHCDSSNHPGTKPPRYSLTSNLDATPSKCPPWILGSQFTSGQEGGQEQEGIIGEISPHVFSNLFKNLFGSKNAGY